MTEQTQIYKGRYGDERPSEAQLELLRKMNVRSEVIASLNRQEAFALIRKVLAQYYGAKAERYLQGRGVIKW